MKKALRTCLAALVMGVLMFAGLVAPAQAHHGDLTQTYVCDVNTGEYVITNTQYWSNVPRGVTGQGTTSTGGTFTTSTTEGSYTWTHRIPGTSKSSPWEYVEIKFSNGHTVDSQRRIDRLAGDCAKTKPKQPDPLSGVEKRDSGPICVEPANGTAKITYEQRIWAQGWVFDTASWAWVLQEKEYGDWETVKVDTVESETCRPEQPAPKVQTRTTIGETNCDTLTTTTYTERREQSYVWNGKKWVLGEWTAWTKVEGSEQTRDAKPGECQFYLETSATAECGSVTVSLTNHSPWIYPLSVSVDGGPFYYIGSVDNRGTNPNHQTGTWTIDFAEDSGEHTVQYKVAAGTESDLYNGQPAGETRSITTTTNCEPDVVTLPSVDVVSQICTTGDQGVAQYTNGSIAVTGEHISQTIIRNVETGEIVADPTDLEPGEYRVVVWADDWTLWGAADGWNITHDGTRAARVVTIEQADDCTVLVPDPVTGTETREETVCNDPADGTATTTVYGRDWAQGWLWNSETLAWDIPAAKVYGDEYVVSAEQVDSESCEPESPSEPPTTPGEPNPTPEPSEPGTGASEPVQTLAYTGASVTALLVALGLGLTGLVTFLISRRNRASQG